MPGVWPHCVASGAGGAESGFEFSSRPPRAGMDSFDFGRWRSLGLDVRVCERACALMRRCEALVYIEVTTSALFAHGPARPLA